MRATILTILLFISTSASAWFNVNATCNISRGAQAVCQVCNYGSYRPIFCQMRITGQTYYGAWFSGNQNGAVQSGLCISGYVGANNPYRDPLVRANAQVRCRF